MSRTTVTYDGHEITADYLASDLRSQLLPRAISMEEVTGVDGSVFTGARLQPRTIAMTLTVRATTLAEQRAAARRLAALLATEEPRPLALSVDGGLYYLAIPQSTGDGDRFVGATRFDVSFLVPDPVMWGAQRSVTVPSGGSVTFEVGGTAPTMPRISAPSAVPSGGVWGLALEDGKRLMVEPGTTSSRAIVADCDARTITVGGSAALLLPAYDWLELAPGSHTLTMTGTGAATVTYRERWY